MKRADIADTASQLRAILDAIACGELSVTTTERARLEGAVVALDTLAGSSSPS
ncbi:hypothetical protein [Mycolicibacterium sp. CR10]|uniref:hypothetical protein n=1 Tax=Mycolicibacterium sp. CR10 TaxID=2562314 RepID=UPI0014854BCA|nr:hypothetical protein [Mycolicibacterium sp. CR10]